MHEPNPRNHGLRVAGDLALGGLLVMIFGTAAVGLAESTAVFVGRGVSDLPMEVGLWALLGYGGVQLPAALAVGGVYALRRRWAGVVGAGLAVLLGFGVSGLALVVVGL